MFMTASDSTDGEEKVVEEVQSLKNHLNGDLTFMAYSLGKCKGCE